jgi:DNA (cytosine-5)-methyltransferase 1
MVGLYPPIHQKCAGTAEFNHLERMFLLCSDTARSIIAMTPFANLCEKFGISVQEAANSLQLSVDIVADYVSGARVPPPRELQILRGLAFGQVPEAIRTTHNEPRLIRSQKSGRMPQPKQFKSQSSSKLTSLELCAGGGGAALGLESAGFHPRALVELDPHACATLRSNRPYWNVIQGDIRKIGLENWRGVDLLSGGLPCPPFSIAGKQLGPDDERDLFPAMLKIVKDIQPRAVLIENVRGIITDRFAFYREKIDTALHKQGFDTYWAAFNAVNFGVPQTRFRAFLVALRRNETKPLKWPFDFDKNPTPPVTVASAIGTMMEERGWRGADEWKKRANEPAPTVVGGSHKHGGPDLGPTRARKEWAELGVDGLGLANAAPEKDFVGMPRLTIPMVARLQSFPEE